MITSQTGRRSGRGQATIVIAAALAASCVVAGCANASGARPAASGAASATPFPGQARGVVTVFAAASLTNVFRRLGQDFEAANPGAIVNFQFGGSDALARQIDNGAPADVFAAANEATMSQVSKEGHVAGESTVFVRNQLEIAVAPGNPRHITRLADLARRGVKVALCAPRVPCGDAARAALMVGNVSVTPVTLEQDVTGALNKVELGEVDAALVYQTDVKGAGNAVTGVQFPAAASAVNDYRIAVLTPAVDPAGGRAFIAYLLSPAGRSAFSRAGFLIP